MFAEEPKDDDRSERRRQQRRAAAMRRDQQRHRLITVTGIIAVLTVSAVGIRLLVGDGRSDPDAPAPEQIAAEPPAPPTALEVSARTRPEQHAAVKKVLTYTPFLRQGTPGKRRVALTFDDGPGAQTEQVLQILKEHDAPSTFFISGYMLEEHHEIVDRILREGHAIGNHGQDHMHMGQLPARTQASQYNQVTAEFKRYGFPVPNIFRPPYGSFNGDTLELLRKRRSLMVLWSADTADYAQLGSESIAATALEGAKPGAVILMHDAGGDRAQTIEALPKILRGLKKRRLQPVTVPELLIDNPPPRTQTLEDATAVPPPGVATTG